jgi:hypothetical protein
MRVDIPKGFVGFYNGDMASYCFDSRVNALRFYEGCPLSNHYLEEVNGVWVWFMDYI